MTAPLAEHCIEKKKPIFLAQLSNDPEVVSSFVFKKLQELYDKHNETNDPKQLRDEEMTLARSALAIFIGKFCNYFGQNHRLASSRN